MIEKIKNSIKSLEGKKVKFRYNGSRNQIEEFEGVIKGCYNSIIVIETNNMNRSFTYTDILIGLLEFDI